MMELAVVSSNRTKIEFLAKKSTSAQFTLELIDNPSTFLSTIQIGITIIGVIAGAFSGQRFAEPLGVWLNTFPWVHGYGDALAFFSVIVFVTYVTIVLGELIPKCIAIAEPEKIACLLARPIRLFSKFTYPFVIILDFSTKIVLKAFNQKGVNDSLITAEEIHAVLHRAFEEGSLDALEHKIFKNLLQFGSHEANAIMTPRVKVVYLDIADSLEENTKKILEYPHRYYPVFEGGLDNFKGILDTRDIFIQQLQGEKLNLRSLIKDIPCIIDNNLGPALLKQFKEYKTHIVVVVDEYGVMLGIITLVDLFEALVGYMPESDQDNQHEIVVLKDGSLLCDGLTPINEIEESLSIEILPAFEEESFNTLAGFLLVIFQDIPRAGEYIHWRGFQFTIMDTDGTRIDKVMIQKQEPSPAPAAESESI